MEMERVYGSIKIKSNWFDWNNEKRKILKIGHEGLDMYFTLGKYRLARTPNTQDYTFHVSIDSLRKETGYSTIKIIELLKLLKSQKIITMKKPSRWDRLYNENGKLNDKEMITFVAIDVPKLDSIKAEGDNMPKEEPRTDDDYYIPVDLDVLEYYRTVGLNEKYFPLYCLLRKLSNGTERKAYMTIHKMAKTLGVHHDTIHKYIKELNVKFLLCSVKKKGFKKNYRFEHHLADSAIGYQRFLNAYMETMQRNAKRWENKVSDKEKVVNSSEDYLDVEIVEDNWSGNSENYPILEYVDSDQYEQAYSYH